LSALAESVLVYVCLYAPSHRCVAHITLARAGCPSDWLYQHVTARELLSGVLLIDVEEL